MFEYFPIDPNDFDGTVLVTGAGGCIGSWALALLNRAGVRAAAFDLSEDKRRPKLLLSDADLAKVQWLTGDIADSETVLKAVQASGARSIIHLAALQVPFCKADPVLGARVNVVGHDWGSVAAWCLALAHPQRVASAVAISVGHPREYALAGWEQKRKGLYTLAWQARGLAESRLSRRDFAGLRRWARRHPGIDVQHRPELAADRHVLVQVELRSLDLDSDQLLGHLKQLVTKFQFDNEIDARFVSDADDVQLRPGVCVEVARIAQEALVNVRKHSGAGKVLVRFSRRPGDYILTVTDNGRGFGFSGRRTHKDLLSSGEGPSVIMERAREIQARVEIESLPGSGSSIEVSIPIHPQPGT